METKPKKETNGQLQKRIKNALIHIDRTKDTKSIYFSDKGLRMTVNEEYAVIETGFHRHIFTNFTSSGVSRPYLYTQRLVEIALENDCATDNGYSYIKLMDNVKLKEDKSDYNLVTFIDWWLFNIFAPLYTIGESELESFVVYEDYLHNIARNAIILKEKDKDITNIEFIKDICRNELSYIKGITEYVIIKKKTDKEIMQENIEAMQEQEVDQVVVESSAEVESENENEVKE